MTIKITIKVKEKVMPKILWNRTIGELNTKKVSFWDMYEMGVANTLNSSRKVVKCLTS